VAIPESIILRAKSDIGITWSAAWEDRLEAPSETSGISGFARVVGWKGFGDVTIERLPPER
jgi:hypothetical protein